MATIRRRGWITSKGERKEAWRVRYVDQHGETRTKQFDLKRDADAYRIKVEGEVASGTHTADSVSVTVADAAKLWIAGRKAEGCSRGTLKTYKEIVDCHIVPLVGTTKLSRLSTPRVIEFREALLETRSTAMARKAVRHLSMILIDAKSRGLVALNAAEDVKVRQAQHEKGKLAKRAEIPESADLKAMIAAADSLQASDPRLAVMVRIAMLTGLRASELRGLTWTDIDLKRQQVTVSRKADRWNELQAPKSAAGIRTVPFGPGLASILTAWKLQCPPSSLGVVFPNRPKGRQTEASKGRTNGGPIKQHTMAALLLKVQIAAGIARDSGKLDEDGAATWSLRYDWHHLRHVAASNWLNDGIDLKRLQVWIGHENIQLTIDVYGHLIADAKKDAALAAGAEAALLA
jgi:integrase